jgi:uncharacterized protein YbjT (DUF2867 family)
MVGGERMPKSVLVTGATGTLGRAVVPRLAAAGAAVQGLSRRPHASDDGSGVRWAVGDLRRRYGIAAALSGVDVIVHCATAPRGDADAARNLIDAARAAGSPHLVYISIVGIDALPMGYYRAKLDVERLVADSGLPVTILRATQFHDLLVWVFAAQRRLPVLLVPARTSFQPVDAGEVADRLVELALGQPAGRVDDLGGPEVRAVDDLARAYLRFAGRRRRVQPLWIPGRPGRALRSGALLTPEHATGRITFEQSSAVRSA